MKKENILLSVVAVGAVGFLVYKKFIKKSSDVITMPEETAPQTPATITLNRNLILKKGIKGYEVKELQRLLGVTTDGIFGPITASALLKLKGVYQISLNSFGNTPTIKQNALAIGTNLMANQGGSKLYESTVGANGYTYTTDTIYKTIAFGSPVGKIVGMNAKKTLYVVSYPGFFGNVNVWVSASEVQKI